MGLQGMSNEHDERAVEALARELWNVAWPSAGVGFDINAEGYRRLAAFVLARESALVTALVNVWLEARIAQDAINYPESGTPYNIARDCANRIVSRVESALAAPRAATQPSEPSLAEAVERMFSNATSVLPFVSMPMEFKRDDVDAVRAALARERGQQVTK